MDDDDGGTVLLAVFINGVDGATPKLAPVEATAVEATAVDVTDDELFILLFDNDNSNDDVLSPSTPPTTSPTPPTTIPCFLDPTGEATTPRLAKADAAAITASSRSLTNAAGGAVCEFRTAVFAEAAGADEAVRADDVVVAAAGIVVVIGSTEAAVVAAAGADESDPPSSFNGIGVLLPP